MTNAAIIAVALAASAFFSLHIFRQVVRALDARRRREERQQLGRELEDEIRNGGNLARIGQLYKRMQELAD